MPALSDTVAVHSSKLDGPQQKHKTLRIEKKTGIVQLGVSKFVVPTKIPPCPVDILMNVVGQRRCRPAGHLPWYHGLWQCFP